MGIRINRVRVICCAIAAMVSGQFTRAAIIGIDNKHSSFSFPPLAVNPSHTTYRSIIEAEGHTLVPVATFDAATLSGLRALILVQALETPQVYTGSEIASIQAFAQSGGGLVVHGEGGHASDSTAANLNQLVAPFGLSYASSATEGSGHTITGFVPHPVTAGLTAIGVDFQRREISFTGPAVDLTLGSGADDALAAVTGTSGAGNAVFLSDTSMFSNTGAGSDRPISFGDNQQLVRNLVEFVTIPEPATIVLLGGALGVMLRRERGRS